MQVLAAQPLSTTTVQFLVPSIKSPKLFAHCVVLQVMAAQELSATQFLVPLTVVIPLLQVVVLQVLAAQPLSITHA